MRKAIMPALLSAAFLFWASSAIAATNATLSWQQNSNNEDGFKVERKIGSGAYIQIGTTGVDVTTAIDPNLLPGTAYCYRVRAYNSAGDSAYSNEACTMTPQIVPGGPTNVTVTVTSTP